MKPKNLLVAALICTFSIGTLMAKTHSFSKGTPLEMNYNAPTIIEMLQNGERYSIEITSLGCFHGTRQTLTVSKEADIVTAHFQDKTIVLSEKEIQALVNFELQLRDLKIGGCTTVDTYVLRYGQDKFQTSDGTCMWNGGKKLLQNLGLL